MYVCMIRYALALTAASHLNFIFTDLPLSLHVCDCVKLFWALQRGGRDCALRKYTIFVHECKNVKILAKKERGPATTSNPMKKKDWNPKIYLKWFAFKQSKVAPVNIVYEAAGRAIHAKML
jgi:hypothetical protein